MLILWQSLLNGIKKTVTMKIWKYFFICQYRYFDERIPRTKKNNCFGIYINLIIWTAVRFLFFLDVHLVLFFCPVEQFFLPLMRCTSTRTSLNRVAGVRGTRASQLKSQFFFLQTYLWAFALVRHIFLLLSCFHKCIGHNDIVPLKLFFWVGKYVTSKNFRNRFYIARQGLNLVVPISADYRLFEVLCFQNDNWNS